MKWQDSGGDRVFENAPAGTHIAVITRVVDLGTQEKTFADEVKRQKQISIGWTLVNTQMEDGRPFLITQDYTLSAFVNGNLRKSMAAWLGTAFSTDEEFQEYLGPSLGNLLGTIGMVSVIHKPSKDGSKTYANVGSLMPLADGMPVPELPEGTEFETVDLEPELFDLDAFMRLSKYMRGKIAKSPEFSDLLDAGLVTPDHVVADRLAAEHVQDDQPADEPVEEFPEEPANMLAEDEPEPEPAPPPVRQAVQPRAAAPAARATAAPAAATRAAAPRPTAATTRPSSPAKPAAKTPAPPRPAAGAISSRAVAPRR